MVDKINDNVKKRDLDLILEVNKKAIEIETCVVEQNEEIISRLNELEKNNIAHDLKADRIIEQNDKIIEQNESASKDLFRIQVLFITGLLTLIGQIIQIFLKR